MNRSVTLSGVGADAWGMIVREYTANMRRKLLSEGTVHAYSWALEDFGRFILMERELEDLADLELEDIEAWEDHLRTTGGLTGNGRAPRSQQMARAALRQCLKFASHRGLQLDPAIFDGFSAMRVPRGLPRPLAPVHVDRITAYLSPRRPKADLRYYRMRAMWFYMVSTGARVSEVLSLDRDDLDSGAPVVTQKGGGQKVLFAPEFAQTCLWDYLQRRQDDHPAVFLSHGNPPHHRLEPSGVREMWHRLADDLGIPRFTTHQLRHTCATELLDAGVPVDVVAKHLGHRGMHTIANYAEVRMGRRQAAVDAMQERLGGALKPAGQNVVAIRNGRGRRVELA
jgi:site-specific recombinase XerD